MLQLKILLVVMVVVLKSMSVLILVSSLLNFLCHSSFRVFVVVVGSVVAYPFVFALTSRSVCLCLRFVLQFQSSFWAQGAIIVLLPSMTYTCKVDNFLLWCQGCFFGGMPLFSIGLPELSFPYMHDYADFFSRCELIELLLIAK